MEENKVIEVKQKGEEKKKEDKTSEQNKQKSQDKPVQQKISKKEELRKDLIAMEFEKQLIDKALETAEELEQAIQIMVSILQTQDQLQNQAKGQIQLILLVRMDLKMGMGKIAAQCAHAVLKAYQNGRFRAQQQPQYSMTFIQWLQRGQKQALYKVQDEQQLYSVLQQCKELGAQTVYIRDAGRTQIAAGSATVGAIGPLSSQKVRLATKDLQIF